MLTAILLAQANNANIPNEEEIEYHSLLDTFIMITNFFGAGATREEIFNGTQTFTAQELQEFRIEAQKQTELAKKYATIHGKTYGAYTELFGKSEEGSEFSDAALEVLLGEYKPFSEPIEKEFFDPFIDSVYSVIEALGFESAPFKELYRKLSDEKKCSEVQIKEILKAFNIDLEFSYKIFRAVAKAVTDKNYEIGTLIDNVNMHKEVWEELFKKVRIALVNDSISYDLAVESIEPSMNVAVDGIKAATKFIFDALAAFTYPIFKLFGEDPQKKINGIIKECDDIFKENPLKNFMFKGYSELLKSFMEDGIDLSDNEFFEPIFDTILLIFDDNTKLFDTAIGLAEKNNNTQLVKYIYAFGNITSNLADENKPIYDTIHLINETFPFFPIETIYNSFVDLMKSLADKNKPIYDALIFIDDEEKNIAINVTNEIINTAGKIINSDIRFNDIFGEMTEFIEALPLIKTIFTGANVNAFIKEYSGMDTKAQELVPYLEALAGEKSALSPEYKTMAKNVADIIEKKGDNLMTTDIFEVLGLAEEAKQMAVAIDLCINNGKMIDIIKALPNIRYNIYETIKNISEITVPSLYNFANSIVIVQPNNNAAASKSVLMHIYDFTEIVSTTPKTVTINTVCTNFGIDAKLVVAPMKIINEKTMSIKTVDFANEASGKDLTKVSQSLTKLAKAGKNGKVTLNDVSDAASAAQEAFGVNTPPKKSNTVAIAIGCSVAAVVVVLIIVGIVYFTKRRNNSNEDFVKI